MSAAIQNDAEFVEFRGEHTWRTHRGLLVTSIAMVARPHELTSITSESTTIVFRSVAEIDRFAEQIAATLARARADLIAANAAAATTTAAAASGAGMCEHKRGTYTTDGDRRCRVCNKVVEL